MSDPILRPGFCDEKAFLEEQLDAAVRKLMELHKADSSLRMHGAEAERFDPAVRLAQRNREEAKRRLLAHIETHRCLKLE